MDLRQEKILHYSNEILDYLLKFKELHPDFTFSLRQRDSIQSDVKRLEAGQWFQGSDYIYVPLFKKGDSARKIKSLGFIIEFGKSGNISKSSIIISFKSGIENENEIAFHKRLASKIGLELNDQNFGDKYFDNPKDVFINLDYFITDVRNTALTLLQELGLKKQYVYSESDFQKRLTKINEVKLERLTPKEDINYWIFQGSPKIYDTVGALNANAIKTWTVSAHRDKIKSGDKIILWLTGANSGCYALGRVDSEVSQMKEEDIEMSYYLAPEDAIDAYRVKIIIEHNFVDNPVLWEMIKDDQVFKDFKGSTIGTNFSTTKLEYQTIKELALMEYENFEKVLNNFEFEDLKSYFNLLFEIFDTLNLKQGEKRLLFSYRKDRLSFTIGQRIALVLLKKHQDGKYFVLTKDIIRATSKNFAGKEPLPYGTFLTELDLNPSEKQSVFDGILQEIKRVQKSSYRSKNYSDFEAAVFDPAFRQRFQKTTNPIMSYKAPINQILYGPPGTGKTYTLKTDYFPKYTLKETSITKELFFEETVRNLTWWQVVALALVENGTSRVNDILTNRWVALKANLSESKNVRATIWGTLQMHTIQESKTVAYTQRQTPFIFDKKVDKSWMLLESELKEQSPEVYDILESVNNFKANPEKEIKHYVFTTFHQSFSYEDFIEGIKPKMDDETETNELTYKIEPGIFKELCTRAQSDPSNRYAIFIDEINRGNVSQIFGELITLIETDKRLGAVNQMKVKLPYSKKEFGVPSNIDIYGTMNTADRSVEALDTALRRRFSFKELMPNSAVVDKKDFTDYPRSVIMEKMNNRIEVLLDRNHTMGHAYFIKPDFKLSFENEIIPLLQEYFYNDYGKIGLVLGKGFVREKSIAKTNDKSIFADFETKNEVDILKSYELIPFNEVDFDLAIQTLLA